MAGLLRATIARMIGSGRRRSCSFCSRKLSPGERSVAGDTAQICETCAGRVAEIFPSSSASAAQEGGAPPDVG
jgi:hypothetical protein